MQKIVFGKAYSFEGKEYSELTLNFDELTGRDIIAAAKEARALDSAESAVPELSKTYQAVIAAKAAKVPVDLILGLPAKDFVKVTIAAQDFLLG